MWRYERDPDGKFYATAICEKCGRRFRGGNVARMIRCPMCQAEHRRELQRARAARFREKKRAGKVAAPAYVETAVSEIIKKGAMFPEKIETAAFQVGKKRSMYPENVETR